MVAINTTEKTQRIFVPLPESAPAGELSFTARNTTDHREVTFRVAEAQSEAFLLVLVVSLPDGFRPGEWEYTLAYDGVPFAEGLMDAREKAEAAPVQYEPDSSFKQYDAD